MEFQVCKYLFAEKVFGRIRRSFHMRMTLRFRQSESACETFSYQPCSKKAHLVMSSPHQSLRSPENRNPMARHPPAQASNHLQAPHFGLFFRTSPMVEQT